MLPKMSFAREPKTMFLIVGNGEQYHELIAGSRAGYIKKCHLHRLPAWQELA
jgi:hypothetical protein